MLDGPVVRRKLQSFVSKLNPGYSYDQEVLGELIRASTLATVFRDPAKGDAIYEAVLASVGRTSHILHQRGLYEMRVARDMGMFDRAESYLNAFPYRRSPRYRNAWPDIPSPASLDPIVERRPVQAA
jgi:hypothetical protein